MEAPEVFRDYARAVTGSNHGRSLLEINTVSSDFEDYYYIELDAVGYDPIVFEGDDATFYSLRLYPSRGTVFALRWSPLGEVRVRHDPSAFEWFDRLLPNPVFPGRPDLRMQMAVLSRDGVDS